MLASPEDVLAFWLDEVGPDGWYAGGEKLDQLVCDKCTSLYERACAGALSLWLTYPSGTLAYIILTDQFSRNMFRDTSKAFATDRIDEPARQFFYMPLMHSEILEDQDRAVRLFKSRMPETGEHNLPHARAHREVIRRYGRFPTRNAALSRETSADEQTYLDNGGYGAIVREIKEKVVA